MSNIVEFDGTDKVEDDPAVKHVYCLHIAAPPDELVVVEPGVNVVTFAALIQVSGEPVSRTSETLCGGVPTDIVAKYEACSLLRVILPLAICLFVSEDPPVTRVNGMLT